MCTYRDWIFDENLRPSEFEAVMRDARQRLSGGFRKVAVLVKSQVGRLQIQRYFEQDQLPAKAFLDEKEAVKWLEAV